MRLYLMAVTCLLIACGQEKTSQQKSPSGDSTTVHKIDTSVSSPQPAVPVQKKPSADYITPNEAPVNKALLARFGNEWHVLNDREASWIKDAFDYFIVSRRKEQPDYPYIALGDFNGDEKQDTAAMVTNKGHHQYRIAVLLAGSKALLWDEDILADAAIQTFSKSMPVEVMNGEKIKKIKLKNDGINVEYFERASFVLYLDKGKLKRLQTGD